MKYTLKNEGNFLSVKKIQKRGNSEIRILLFNDDEIKQIADLQKNYKSKKSFWRLIFAK